MLYQVRSLTVCLCLFSLSAYSIVDTTSLKETAWFMPKGGSFTYAGGYGMFSTGVYFSPLKKTELEFTVGYSPPAYGDVWAFNTLISYKTFLVRISDKFVLKPVNAGIFVNMNFGKNIYFSWPEHNKDDYWWSSAIRIGPFINSELIYSTSPGKLNYTFFFHCSTNDLYVASWYNNKKTIALDDILIFGIGIKIGVE